MTKQTFKELEKELKGRVFYHFDREISVDKLIELAREDERKRIIIKIKSMLEDGIPEAERDFVQFSRMDILDFLGYLYDKE